MGGGAFTDGPSGFAVLRSGCMLSNGTDSLRAVQEDLSPISFLGLP